MVANELMPGGSCSGLGTTEMTDEPTTVGVVLPLMEVTCGASEDNEE